MVCLCCVFCAPRPTSIPCHQPSRIPAISSSSARSPETLRSEGTGGRRHDSIIQYQARNGLRNFPAPKHPDRVWSARDLRRPCSEGPARAWGLPGTSGYHIHSIGARYSPKQAACNNNKQVSSVCFAEGVGCSAYLFAVRPAAVTPVSHAPRYVQRSNCLWAAIVRLLTAAPHHASAVSARIQPTPCLARPGAGRLKATARPSVSLDYWSVM